LRELTLEVEQFSAVSVRRGQSAWCWRTVRTGAVRRVFFVCSSCSCALCFRSGFALGFRCSRFADGPSFSSGRSVARADGPPGLRGRSVFLGSVLVVLFALTGGPRLRPNSPRQGCGRSAAQAGQSTARVRTVRGTLPDGPRSHRGQSALPGRTVRQRLPALLLGSIPPFLSSASVCASRNRS
jgi:hypothetical protein